MTEISAVPAYNPKLVGLAALGDGHRPGATNAAR